MLFVEKIERWVEAYKRLVIKKIYIKKNHVYCV